MILKVTVQNYEKYKLGRLLQMFLERSISDPGLVYLISDNLLMGVTL